MECNRCGRAHLLKGAAGYYHLGYYGVYHAPTGGAVAAGLVAETALGAAAASSANANTANQACQAGVAAGAASATMAANPSGTLYGTLPAGCACSPLGGQPCYSCADGLWFVPGYGANGAYYRVVPAP